MIPLAILAVSGCLAVGAASDQVLAGDFAAVYPEWAAVPKETPLGLAPAPGVERVFRVLELRRLATRWNVSPAPDHDVCASRPVAVLTPELLLAAMRKETPTARIDLLDFSRQPAPHGELTFPPAGLQQGPSGGYWHGYVQYAGARRFAVWARVKVLVAGVRVVAAEDLKLGEPVTAAQLRVETRDELFSNAHFPTAPEEVTGKLPRHAIAAGTTLRDEWLEPPKAVLRGETVAVEVMIGGAHLKLEATAETSGAIGETILVLNPVSKHRFPARVEGKGESDSRATGAEGNNMKSTMAWTMTWMLLALSCVAADKKKPEPKPQASPLDRYVSEAKARFAEAPAAAPGGIWAPGSRLADSTRDMRASQVDDVITIVVVENASAVVSGGTSTERASSTANSIGALGGLTKVGGLWNNLAATSGDTKLKGSGTTSRNMVISTTMTARVSAVLPNGVMLVEASKDVEINTERQDHHGSRHRASGRRE